MLGKRRRISRFFFSSRRRHTRLQGDWSSDVCSSNLRVAYNLGLERPSFTNAYELADRYMGGLHVALPYGWNADLYYSETYDSSFNNVTNSINKNAVLAALG